LLSILAIGGLALGACTPRTQQAIDLAVEAHKVSQCEEARRARLAVQAAFPLLSASQIEDAVAISDVAAIHCSTDLPLLIRQLETIRAAAIAKSAPTPLPDIGDD
jgi:hypothetical protein